MKFAYLVSSCNLRVSLFSLQESDLYRLVICFIGWAMLKVSGKHWVSLPLNGIHLLQCHGSSVTKMCLVRVTAFPQHSE